MASKQHDDEFELILGNKQLLSLFFVIVAFFAAFFSVGYVVGYGHGEQTTVTSAEDEPLGLPERALTAAGLAFWTASMKASRFSSSLAASKEALPIPAWTTPAFSTLN